MGVKEGFFLDRIALSSGSVSPRNIECPTSVVADFAHSGLAFGNRATMSAGEAAHTMVLKFFVEKRISLADSLVQNTAEGAHGGNLCLILTLSEWNGFGFRLC
jgi:hypothetical protein